MRQRAQEAKWTSASRHVADEGFTLVEVLVVILIIGILAAVALPAFLNQRERAQDTEAKANARNLYSVVEACHADKDSYAGCTTAVLDTSDLPIGTGTGQVDVIGTPTATTFRIEANSRSGGVFVVERTGSNSPVARTCSGGTTGCNGTSW